MPPEPESDPKLKPELSNEAEGAVSMAEIASTEETRPITASVAATLDAEVRSILSCFPARAIAINEKSNPRIETGTTPGIFIPKLKSLLKLPMNPNKPENKLRSARTALMFPI